MESHQAEVVPRSMLDWWDLTVSRSRTAPIVHYFDRTLTAGEIDQMSDALAHALVEHGVTSGSRVGVYLQNVPQFVIAVLGVWKCGAIVLPINPMYRDRELRHVLTDSGASVLICLESLYTSVASAVVTDTDVRLVLTTSELDLQDRHDERMFAGMTRTRPGRGNATGRGRPVRDLLTLIAAHAGDRAPRPDVDPSEPAVLTYTSGTTGAPKGAINTHGGLAFNARTFRDWGSLEPEHDVNLGLAPMFHITGMVAHLATTLVTGVPLVLTYRFDPDVVADAAAARTATFTIAAITAFIAVLNSSTVRPERLRSLTKVLSGGAAVPGAVVVAFEERFGTYIHNAYGLTEAHSATHIVPLGLRAPIDGNSGALSIGRCVPGTEAYVVGADAVPVPHGTVGELLIDGPQVFPGYWHRPDETANALVEGRLCTGDAAYVDAEGWWFLVDRIKDQINVSGYKVWPREVEDVLYEHPAVREVAVVGVPDAYRGETVHAFVSVRPGHSVTEDELVHFTRARLARYKAPRQVVFLADLPRTTSGKILRRELREHR